MSPQFVGVPSANCWSMNTVLFAAVDNVVVEGRVADAARRGAVARHDPPTVP
jgi:hypothetical protein